MSNTDLPKCPACGNQVTIAHEEYEGWCVQCYGCDLIGGSFPTEALAFSYWRMAAATVEWYKEHEEVIKERELSCAGRSVGDIFTESYAEDKEMRESASQGEIRNSMAHCTVVCQARCLRMAFDILDILHSIDQNLFALKRSKLRIYRDAKSMSFRLKMWSNEMGTVDSCVEVPGLDENHIFHSNEVALGLYLGIKPKLTRMNPFPEGDEDEGQP